MTQRYGAYKDSGVEWIGEIPEHWEVKKAKILFGNLNVRDQIDEPLLSVTQKDSLVKRDELETRVWNPESDLSAYKLVRNGDFVISLRTFEGGIELSNVQGIVSPAYTVLCQKVPMNELYYKFLLKSTDFITELNKVTTGIRQGKNISYEDFSQIYLPSPPVHEQKMVGESLISKTSLIDRLVDVKQRRIELLKEKRAALINQAVTKGLDPNAKMKDSGIEWIGEIPEHWRLKKFKHISEIVTGNTPSKVGGNDYYTLEHDGVLWIKPTDLSGNQYTIRSEEKLTEEGLALTRPIPFESIMICCIGNTLGKYGISGEEKVTTNQQINSIVVDNEQINSWYCLYYVDVFTRDLINRANFVTLPIYTKSDLENSEILIPSHGEQLQIANYLNSETKKIDDLVALEQKKIDLLKEYRQALISETVTGKIKIGKETGG